MLFAVIVNLNKAFINSLNRRENGISHGYLYSLESPFRTPSLSDTSARHGTTRVAGYAPVRNNRGFKVVGDKMVAAMQ